MAAMLEEFFWELSYLFMQIRSFVSVYQYGHWSRERTHSMKEIIPLISIFAVFCVQPLKRRLLGL